MSPVSSGSDRLSRRRRTLANGVRDRLRALNRQLSVLNHVVGARLKLRDIDLDCLELIAAEGPISPSELARRSGVHPATMTGILDRLERASWIARERDPEATDRRGVGVRMRPERVGEVFRLYSVMLSAVGKICAGYSEQELELIGDFLDRVAAAGREAADAVLAPADS